MGGQYWTGHLERLEAFKSFNEEQVAPIFQQFPFGINDFECLATEETVMCGSDSGAVQLFSVKENSFQAVGFCLEHDNFVTSVSIFSDQISAASGAADCV